MTKPILTIRTVFFDLGGTLLMMRRDRIISKILTGEGYPVRPENVHAAYFRAEPSWLRIYGERRMDGEETEEAYRQLDAMICRLLFPRQPADEVERLSGLTRSQWPTVEKTIPLELYHDAVPTLERLKSEGYTMGLVSNAPPDTVKAVEFLGLPRYLPVIVISGVVGVSKPNPEIFRIALSRSGAEPNEAIHVGDVYEADVLGARNAGIKGLLIDRDGLQADADCPRVTTLSDIYPHLR
jgi:putative hydrolase of the HAD superfamily